MYPDAISGDKNCICLSLNRNLCCFPSTCGSELRNYVGKCGQGSPNPFEIHLPSLLEFLEEPKETTGMVIQIQLLLFFSGYPGSK